MPAIDKNLAMWSDPENWPEHGEGWSQTWGSSESMWHGSILPRIAPFLPAAHIVEIACGHGRVTRFLHAHCEHFVGVDLSPTCVEHCRQRFADVAHAEFHETDGSSIDRVTDSSIDFAFSWDSLVHADAKALGGYLIALARKLRPGGAAFLHHSNLGAYVDESGQPTVENPHWRDSGVSASLVRDLASGHGLVCRSQELVQWGAPIYNDCFSLLRRPLPGSAAPADPRVSEHPDMAAEMNHFRRLGALSGAD